MRNVRTLLVKNQTAMQRGLYSIARQGHTFLISYIRKLKLWLWAMESLFLKKEYLKLLPYFDRFDYVSTIAGKKKQVLITKQPCLLFFTIVWHSEEQYLVNSNFILLIATIVFFLILTIYIRILIKISLEYYSSSPVTFSFSNFFYYKFNPFRLCLLIASLALSIINVYYIITVVLIF